MFRLLEPYPDSFLFVTGKHKIKAIDLLTIDTTNVVHGLVYQSPMSFTIDIVDKRLYFKNGTNIARSRLDGTDTEIILRKIKPWDITMDWKSRRIFWTEFDERKISVANSNGKDKRVIRFTHAEQATVNSSGSNCGVSLS